MSKQSVEERFWSKVNKNGPIQAHVPGISRCWMWTAARRTDGYGVFRLPDKFTSAHRASWEISFGQIRDGLWVLHKCDNKSCVRPEHLFLGTNQENIWDMVRKGRRPTGTKSYQAKLTEEQVLIIRSSPLGASALARKYDVCRETVRDVIEGRTWKHLLQQKRKAA